MDLPVIPYRLILEGMNDGVALWDADFRLRLMNAALIRLHALPEALTHPGTPGRDILHYMLQRGDFGPPPGTEAAVDAALEKRVTQVMVSAFGEVEIRQSWSGAWIEVTRTPVPGGGVLTFHRDITKRRAREAELGATRRIHELVLERMTDGVVMWDADFRLVFANSHAQRLGEFPDSMNRPGMDVREVIRLQELRGDFGPPPKSSAELEERVQRRTALLQRPGGVSYIRPTPSGLCVEVKTTPLPEGGNVLVYRDITALKQRETELAEAHATQALVLETTSDGLLLWDADFRIRLANGQIHRLYDVPDDLLVRGADGRDILRFMALRGDYGRPGDEAAIDVLVRQRMAEILHPAASPEPDIRQTPTGRWVEISRALLPDGGVLNTYRDVTRLKEREAQLERERATQQLILDNMLDGVALIDRDFRYHLTNRRMRELLAMDGDLGRSNAPVIDVLRARALRGDFGPTPTDEAALDTMIAERVALMRRPGGNSYLRRTVRGRWVEFKTVPLDDGGILSMYRDVTELKEREEELAGARDAAEAAQQALTTTIEHMSQGLLMFNADRRLRVVNHRAAELLRLPLELTRPGTHQRDIIAFQLAIGEFDGSPEFETMARRELNVPTIAPGRFERWRRDGTAIEVHVHDMPDGGQVRTFSDITERKRAEEVLTAALAAAEAARREAEAADRAKSTFLATMSHEIRTPMNGVLGMMEVLERTPLTPDQARCLAVMRESAGALLGIIGDILDFSKIEAGQLELEAVPFSLHGLVEGTTETLAEEARRKGLSLTCFRGGTGPDWVLGDPVRLRQILFNLIGNAIKFTPCGFVRVLSETRAEGGRTVAVAITVEDSGIGLSQDEIGRLFQPFAQADSSTTRRYGGSGLGLSIVRRLAGLMGGNVSVESGLGQGSRFTVTLRLASADERVVPDPEIYPQEGRLVPKVAVHAGERLLVADDHPVNREVLAQQLALLGYEVDMATDGAAALAMWQESGHPLVLVDLHMPVMDGLDLARRIRSEEAASGRRRTALVAVTANALEGEDERCFSAGLDAFVAKPVALVALQRTLEAWLPRSAGASGEPAARGCATPVFDPEALRRIFGADEARLAGLLLRFSDGLREDSAAIARALETSDWNAAAASAHRLNGACRMAGARHLADLAARLERGVRAGDMEAVTTVAAAIPTALTATLEAINRAQ